MPSWLLCIGNWVRKYWRKKRLRNGGNGLIPRLAKNLLAEFPEMKGFCNRNLFYVKKWYLFHSQYDAIVQQAVAQLENAGLEPNITTGENIVPQFGQQLVAQLPVCFSTIPWGHHLQIITKCKNREETLFYIKETAT